MTRSDTDTASHPDWYDPQADFGDARFALALRVGQQAANVGGNDWHRVESVLRDVWIVLHEGLTWEQARSAVYHGWLRAGRTDDSD